jgi:hypothetical protein
VAFLIFVVLAHPTRPFLKFLNGRHPERSREICSAFSHDPLPHGGATPAFVIPSEAEGSAVRLSPKHRPLQVRSHILSDGLMAGT